MKASCITLKGHPDKPDGTILRAVEPGIEPGEGEWVDAVKAAGLVERGYAVWGEAIDEPAEDADAEKPLIRRGRRARNG